MDLQDDVLLLTPLLAEHESMLIELGKEADEKARQWLGARMVPSNTDDFAELMKYFEREAHQQAAKPYVIKIKDSGTPVGFCFLNRINDVHSFANMAYWLVPAYYGNGYAKRACQLLLDLGFGELNLNRIEVVIEPSNQASIWLAQALGCIQEGTVHRRIFGRDAVMFAKVSNNNM